VKICVNLWLKNIILLLEVVGQIEYSLVVVKSDMAVIHEQIKEIEDDLKKLIEKAGKMSITPNGIKQQVAIRSFVSACRGLQGWHLGILKNAFGIGIKVRTLPDGKLEVVE